MSGGVRNLRAMFENKDPSSSSPDRGRSPADSTGAGSTGTSPRPLSKVRTSFVAVGGSGGQLGLQRESSEGSNIAKRGSSREDESHHRAGDVRETIIEELIPKGKVTPSAQPEHEMAVKNQAREPKKQLDGAKVGTKEMSQAPPTEKVEKSGANTIKGPVAHSNGAVRSATTKVVKDSKTAPRPAPISTTKSIAPSRISPNKSVPKTPTTPIKGLSEDTETLEKKPAKKARRESKLAAKPSSKQEVKPIQPAKKSPPHTGFHKPAPRPPTVPVQLPASLMAHTASSGSKSSSSAPAPRQSLSRASGNIQATNPLQFQTAQARSPTRTSQIIHAPSKPLGRSQSTVYKSNPRPSFGPPPSKKQAPRQSLPQSSAPADDGFLARMMRPTTSSASKTTDKQLTPPKKAQPVKRPATKDGPPKMQDLGKIQTAPTTPNKSSEPSRATVTNKPLASSTLTSQPVKKTQLEPKPSQQLPHVTKQEAGSLSKDEPKVTEKIHEEITHKVASDSPSKDAPGSDTDSSKEPTPESAKSTPKEDTAVAKSTATSSTPAPSTTEKNPSPSPLPVALPSPIRQSVISPESPKQTNSTLLEPLNPESAHKDTTDLEIVHSMADTVSVERKGSMAEAKAEPVSEKNKQGAARKQDIPLSNEGPLAVDEEEPEKVNSENAKTENAEDSEDAKAKAEIAALNAALMVGAEKNEGANEKA